MRILLLTYEFPPFPGGVGTYCFELAKATHDLGHAITVVAPNFGDLETSVPFQTSRFRGRTYSWKSIAPLLIRTTVHALNRQRFDLIHAGDWPFAMALALVSRVRPLWFAATVHGTELLGLRQPRWLGITDMFSRARQVFTNSDFTRSLLLRFDPAIDPTNVRTTYLGVADHWFGAVARSASVDLAVRLGLSGFQRTILTVGRLDDRKGHRTVLAGLRLLPAELKAKLGYVIAGGGGHSSYLADLRQRAESCGVPVVFAGVVSRDDLKVLYGLADVFCMPGEPHPRKIEGFGLAYLEAGAQGVPAIASAVGGVPEVVLDGKTGILVPPNDPEAVAAALCDLLENPRKAEMMGAATRERARSFTWAACAEKTYGKP